jgi:type VI secretion system protein ImpJ
MRTKAVNWAEGMLVLPHHFQAEHANLLDWVATAHDWAQPYGYGLRAIEIHEDALKNFELRVPRLQARMRDGTLVSVPENAHIPILDLRPVFAKAQELYIHLVLPEVVSGKSNTSRNGPTVDQRFAVSITEWSDLNSGGTPRNIETQLLSVQLAAQDNLEGPGGYESLPIARLKRSTQAEAPPMIDHNYIPPLVACECWAPLREDILAVVAAKLGAHTKQQADYLRTVGGWSEANQPQIRARIMKLNAVNCSYPYLTQLIHARGIHPFLAYTELCRLVGQLSLFRHDWQPPDLPPYDHDDLGRIFRYVADLLASLLEEQKAAEIARYEFLGVNEWMEVALDPKWLLGNHEFYVGVQTDLNPKHVEKLFTNQFLDWKMGSVRTISQVFRTAQQGVGLRRLGGVHPVLPAISNMNYYEIEQTGPYWDEVVESRVLAFMVNTRFVSGSFVGKNYISVLDANKNKRDLYFYLYVVQK